MRSWVFLSCDVHLAFITETFGIHVYMFPFFVVYGPTISIFFSSTELIQVLDLHTFSAALKTPLLSEPCIHILFSTIYSAQTAS